MSAADNNPEAATLATTNDGVPVQDDSNCTVEGNCSEESSVFAQAQTWIVVGVVLLVVAVVAVVVIKKKQQRKAVAEHEEQV